MKRSPDNQINTSFIDISRIKWLVFLLRSSFFRTTRPLASSEAMAYYQPALSRTDSIPERDQRPCDNGYKSVFTNSWLVRQMHRSWSKGIRQKSTKRVNSFIACSAFCPGPPNKPPRTHPMACIHVNHNDGMPRVACLQVFRQKHTKIGMRV